MILGSVGLAFGKLNLISIISPLLVVQEDTTMSTNNFNIKHNNNPKSQQQLQQLQLQQLQLQQLLLRRQQHNFNNSDDNNNSDNYYDADNYTTRDYNLSFILSGMSRAPQRRLDRTKPSEPIRTPGTQTAQCLATVAVCLEQNSN
jgi:hypothetical protein